MKKNSCGKTCQSSSPVQQSSPVVQSSVYTPFLEAVLSNLNQFLTLFVCEEFMHASVFTDWNSCMEYAEGCYKYSKYHECLQNCDRLLNEDSVEQNVKYKAQVQKCKALYKLFRADYRLLKNERDFLSPKEVHEREKSCYDKVREVVGCLS